MYIVTGVVLILYLVLGFVSRKEQVDAETGRLLRPFTRMAICLHKWVCIRKLPFFSRRQVAEDLARMYPGEGKERKCTEYYVEKLARSLLICLVGTLLGLVVSVQAQYKRNLSREGYVIRGTYETGEKNVELECDLPEGRKQFRVNVSPKVLSEDALEEQYEVFCRKLPEMLLGENPSLREVSSNLILSDAYRGYPFGVEWISNEPDFLRGDGTVELPEEGTQEVILVAKISYGEWEREARFTVNVIPQVLSPEEQLQREMEKMLAASEEANRLDEKWMLPKEWNGKKLYWKERVANHGVMIWLGGILAAVLVYLLSDQDLHSELEKRKDSMRREYPDVVHKLALYLGAGMTMRNVFQRIAGDGGSNPVYEEMLYACRELQAGVSEGAAYEHFGRRTGVQEYIRLSTLLTQNLKKGNSTLLQRLREEAEKASLERVQYAKRLGEEAATKMLLPMVMMLLVVMLMIMIPAFSSVGT